MKMFMTMNKYLFRMPSFFLLSWEKKKTPKISYSRQYICINVFLCVFLNRKTYAEAKTTGYWVCRDPDFKTEKCKEISVLELKCPLIHSEISKVLFLYWLETCFCLPVYNSFHKQYIFTISFSYSLNFFFNIHKKNIHFTTITDSFSFDLLAYLNNAFCRFEVWLSFS